MYNYVQFLFPKDTDSGFSDAGSTKQDHSPQSVSRFLAKGSHSYNMVRAQMSQLVHPTNQNVNIRCALWLTAGCAPG